MSTSQTTIWSKEHTQLFVEIIVEEIDKGNRSYRTATTFNRVGWKNIVEHFRIRSKWDYKMKQLTNKFNELRQEYATVRELLETTGFRWNPITQTYTAENDSIRDNLIKEAELRRQGLPEWPQLSKIFECTYATGKNAITANTALQHTSTVDKTTSAKRRKRKSTDIEVSCASAVRSFSEMCKAKYSRCSKDSVVSNGPDFSITKAIEVLLSMSLDRTTLSKVILVIKSDPKWREVLISVEPSYREIIVETMIVPVQPPN